MTIRSSSAALAGALSLTLLSFAGAAQASAQAAPAARQAPASPRDSVTATIAGATIKVNYGRPSKRGRVVFNGLPDMKWGSVWRAGANEATHMSTTKPLMFGSAMVPAGTYTLYVHLVESGKWELVINKQTGQWGTEYDAKRDLVRVPLTVTSNNPVVEKFTITVAPAATAGNGMLTLAWDNYKATTSFMIH